MKAGEEEKPRSRPLGRLKKKLLLCSYGIMCTITPGKDISDAFFIALFKMSGQLGKEPETMSL